ncbi:MAG: tRNA uridine-5-carboxymethylaminomethyl(34) synthesis GTPase MnmE [Brevinematales bacterium]|nr:tRNA uridine-5-carboxymethylaminomethyl(34) synthesis GTPase MnmE [Brevinematales bacterium]
MNDTIAAIATPIGESAIGVIRISGKDCFSIVKSIFSIKEWKTSYPQVLFGKIIDENKIIDEVLITLFKGPKSYTGEDLAEISCHGSPFILKIILELIIKKGARLAKPGEFTERAYLNGKMDLLKAEAVNDIIKAHTKYSHLAGISQLTGKLKSTLLQIEDGLLELISLIEASIDHSDLEETFISSEKIFNTIEDLRLQIKKLLSTSRAGKISINGLKIAIVGAPNTGKSSIMNALLKEDRVIVSDIAGTTRDVISDEISVRGISVKLFDTAGLRNSEDLLEQKGMEKTKRIIEEADLIFFVLDCNRKLNETDKNIFELLRNKEYIIVLNKIDLPMVTTVEEINYFFGKEPIKISALNQKDLSKIEDEIERFYFSLGYSPENDVLITNIRQENLLEKALNYIDKAINALKQDMSEEFIASDLRKAKSSIEEIIGITKDEEILNKIFSKFCIGK